MLRLPAKREFKLRLITSSGIFSSSSFCTRSHFAAIACLSSSMASDRNRQASPSPMIPETLSLPDRIPLDAHP